jgi:hypothetical protein
VIFSLGESYSLTPSYMLINNVVFIFFLNFFSVLLCYLAALVTSAWSNRVMLV